VAGEHPQRGHLSLIGLVVGYTLFGVVGYLTAGWWGVGCGAALLTVLIARQLWWAVSQGERRGAEGLHAEPAPGPRGPIDF
jgi:hypothetical protein